METKLVDNQKLHIFFLLNAFSEHNPLITTSPNMCEKWVFLNFLETESSYYTDSGHQSYGQNCDKHISKMKFSITQTQ